MKVDKKIIFEVVGLGCAIVCGAIIDKLEKKVLQLKQPEQIYKEFKKEAKKKKSEVKQLTPNVYYYEV